MPSLPTLPSSSLAVGSQSAASWADQVAAWIGILSAPPLFRGHSTAVTSLTNSAFTAVAIDNNDVDTYSGHSTTVNNSRYVGQLPGYYTVVGTVSFVANATGRRLAAIHLNGALVLDSQVEQATISANSNQMQSVLEDVFLNGTTDYVELRAFQSSGGALNTISAELHCRWVHS